MFQWCMVGCESKNRHQKPCVEKKLPMFSKVVNFSKCNSHLNWEEPICLFDNLKNKFHFDNEWEVH